MFDENKKDDIDAFIDDALKGQRFNPKVLHETQNSKIIMGNTGPLEVTPERVQDILQAQSQDLNTCGVILASLFSALSEVEAAMDEVEKAGVKLPARAVELLHEAASMAGAALEKLPDLKNIRISMHEIRGNDQAELEKATREFLDKQAKKYADEKQARQTFRNKFNSNDGGSDDDSSKAS